MDSDVPPRVAVYLAGVAICRREKNPKKNISEFKYTVRAFHMYNETEQLQTKDPGSVVVTGVGVG